MIAEQIISEFLNLGIPFVFDNGGIDRIIDSNLNTPDKVGCTPLTFDN